MQLKHTPEEIKQSAVMFRGMLALFFIAAFVWVRLPNLAAYGNEFDEGIFLMTARLVHAGHPLYAAVFSDAGPLFVASLVSAFNLFGDAAATGRALMLAFAALSLSAMGLWGHKTIGGWGGLLALAALALMPPFAREAGLVLRDIPALGTAVLALFAALNYAARPRQWLAALTGALFAISLLTKFLFPVWGFALAAVLAAPHISERAWKKILLTGIFAAAGAAVPIIFVSLWIDLPEMFRQTFQYRLAVRAVYQEHDLAHNLALIWQFLRGSLFILPLALSGTAIAILRRDWRLGLPVLLFALQLAMLAVQAPLHVHGLVSLLPPLAMLAAIGLNGIFAPRPPHKMAESAVAVLAVVWVMIGLTGQGWPMPEFSAVLPDNPPTEATKMLQAAAAPDTPIISDDPMLVYRAERQSLPWLADTSISRLKSQAVSPAELMALTDSLAVPVVWQSTRFPPPYADWLRENFAVDWTQDGVRHLFLGRKISPSAAPIATFADGLALDAADVAQSPAGLTVNFRWLATASPAHNYTIFTQLLTEAGQVAAQMDRPPLLNLYPTSAWEANAGFADSLFIPLPDNLPAGKYRLIAGLYRADTGERLAVRETSLPVMDHALIINDHLDVTTP